MRLQYCDEGQLWLRIFTQHPEAKAMIRGGALAPNICGCACFYDTEYGVILSAAVTGLPMEDENHRKAFFGFHVHEGTSCTGNTNDSFADTKSHYNPDGHEHPEHAGDLPPLLANNGFAMCAFLIDGFAIQEILGKTLVIHRLPDDFRTQPAGDAGSKIACGVIQLTTSIGA